MGTTAPQGYLICDGSTYNIADYQALADHIAANFGSVSFFGGNGTTTFAVPDLRGEFLRGTGTNSHANQGSGAGVGTHQDGTVTPFARSYIGNDMISVTDMPDDFLERIDFATINNKQYVLETNFAEYDNGCWYTSRPTNTSVLFIIKT